MPGKSLSPWVAEETHRRDKLQPVTTGPTNTRHNQMSNSKHRNITNINQCNMAPFKPNSPRTANPVYKRAPSGLNSNHHPCEARAFSSCVIFLVLKYLFTKHQCIFSYMAMFCFICTAYSLIRVVIIFISINCRNFQFGNYIQLTFKNVFSSRVVVVHTCNPSTWEAEAGGFMSSRSAWSTE